MTEKVVDIRQKQQEREKNWWAYHDKMEAKLLAGNEDLQLLKEVLEVGEMYYEALNTIATDPACSPREIAIAVLCRTNNPGGCPTKP